MLFLSFHKEVKSIRIKTHLLSTVLLSLLLIFFFGCTKMVREEPPTLSGTFRGDTGAGSPVTITFIQDENTITGRGKIGDRVFSLSGITSWHGPIVLNYEDGDIRPAYITLSPDGGIVTISGLGPSITLNHGGEPQRAPSGPFAGRYANTGPPQLWLNLTQGGNLLAGTGYVDGRPVAVVGKVTDVRKATGTILFSDESQTRVKVVLSGDGRTLTIEGLGAPIQMRLE